MRKSKSKKVAALLLLTLHRLLLRPDPYGLACK